MQILSEIAIKAVNENIPCKNRLALKMGRSVDTIERWLREARANNPKENDCGVMLTTAQALEVIRQETKLKDEEILTENPAQA